MKLYPKYKVRVVYKSGYVHDFWVWQFSVKRGDGGVASAEWKSVDDRNKPVMINVGAIETVWQVGYKHVFRFTDPLKV